MHLLTDEIMENTVQVHLHVFTVGSRDASLYVSGDMPSVIVIHDLMSETNSARKQH